MLTEELKHLQKTFNDNGYPDHIVTKILYEENKKNDKKQVDPTRMFYAPYHPKTSRLFQMLENEFQAEIIYSKTATLGEFLTKKRRKPEPIYQKNVVYKIPCKNPCPISYIGQTGKSLKTRVKQHGEMCRRKITVSKLLQSGKKDNGLAYHHLKTGHEFDLENASVLAVEKNYWRRLIVEGIEIKNTANKANLKAGFEISKIWDPFLKMKKTPDQQAGLSIVNNNAEHVVDGIWTTHMCTWTDVRNICLP